MGKLDYNAVDWGKLWQQAQQNRAGKEKKAKDWDNRAHSFAARTATSIYTKHFLQLLRPEAHWTVLDVGSGPGTLALPLSPRVKHITCLDFSGNMLDILNKRAQQHKFPNITTCKAAWEDDWRQLGIRPHEVAIASRSLAVKDLKGALNLLCCFATEKIVITDKVRHGPFDPDAFRALQRPLQTGPDYIYTVNLLYQMGFLASVDYIRLEEHPTYRSFEDAMTGYSSMFPSINPDEKKQLIKYLQSITTSNEDGGVTVHRQHVPTWAFISWNPNERDL